MHKICRTCLKEIASADFVCIDNSDGASFNSVVVKQELAICIPELDLNLVAHAVICTSCVDNLHIAYDFKRKCLQTEGIIHSYVQSNTVEMGYVELDQILGDRGEGNCASGSEPLAASIKAEPVEVNTCHLESQEFFDVNCGDPLGDDFVHTTSEYIKLEPALTTVTQSDDRDNCTEHEERQDQTYVTSNQTDFPPSSPDRKITLKPSEITATKTRIHRCDICGEVFALYNSLCVHKTTHSTNNKDSDQAESSASTTAATSKRKTFTIEDKVNLIRLLESGQKISEVCRAMGLATSTVCCIWKKKDAVLKAFEKNGLNLKRLRKPLHADVDAALLTWCNEQQNADVKLCGPSLKIKAEELARSMGNCDFVCSSGWLERFKARYNICLSKKKRSG